MNLSPSRLAKCFIEYLKKQYKYLEQHFISAENFHNFQRFESVNEPQFFVKGVCLSKELVICNS
jgi:hypothetical protein